MNILSTAVSIIPTGAWGKHLLMPACARLDSIASGIWDGKLNITRELDIEEQSTTEAQNPLDEKGGDKPREFSITVMVFRNATGSSPLTVYHSWWKDLGKCNYFFQGIQPIDTSQYILKHIAIDCGVQDFDANGEMYRADITLDFVEDIILKIVSQKLKEEKSRKGKSKAKKKVEHDKIDAAKILRETKKSYGIE